MTVVVTPISAKGSLYVLIPKDIAGLLELNDKTSLKIKIRTSNHKRILEYEAENSD